MQIFADAISGGDVAKLFKDMENGKVKLEELNKVIDHMGTLTKKDLLTKMLQTPQRALERLSTSWQRFIMAVNNSGALEAMVFIMDTLADGVMLLTKVVKPLGKVITTTFKNAYEYVSMFAGILNGLLFNSFGSTILSVTLLGLVLSQMPKAIAAIGASMTWLWRMFLVPAAVISAILLVEDLIGALLGKDSVIADAAKKDGFLGGLAATFLSIGQFFATIGHVLTAGILEGDWDLAADYIKTFFDKIKENFPNVTEWITGMITKLGHFVKIAFAAGKLVAMPFSKDAQKDMRDAYQNYSNFKATESGVPATLATPNTKGYTPSTSTNSTVINAPISINGTGLDPKQIADAVTEQLNNRTLMAQANYVQLRK